jgi:hypothetical protein
LGRAQIMGLWQDEKWFLQLDSHHRFVQDWDLKLLEQMVATGSPKPILTTYAGAFTPGDHPTSLGPEAMQMEFDRFTDDGLILFRPGVIPEWPSSKKPVRSRFLSAHFLFAPGRFVTEVPYEPNLYFIGEEITLAVRAFTHGYDLFHPGEAIVWHEYTRSYRPKHWDDHTADRGVEFDWAQRDNSSRTAARRLLVELGTGSFGCGSERSISDYEAFAGISFLHRRAQDYTRRHHEPPNPPTDANWVFGIRDHTVRIKIPVSQFPESVKDISQFWYVVVRDKDGKELLRADAVPEEIKRLLDCDSETITIVRRVESSTPPAGWGIRVKTLSDGWLDPIEGELFGNGGDEWTSHLDDVKQDGHQFGSDSGLTRYPKVAPGLSWVKTEEGFLVSRVGNAQRIVVNSTGALILELANGRYSDVEMAKVVGDAFALENPPDAEVAAFLSSASSRGLIENWTHYEGADYE